MKQNKTILEKIGVSRKTVKKWEKAGLKVAYPVKERKKFFKSADAKVFIEAGDKFMPPLTKRERILYTKSPEKFREDFLENVKLHNKFLNFLYEIQKRTKKLDKKEKLIGLLALLYLFQSSIDHHLWHFDRYLAYENYPQTPVGHWWRKLKDLYTKKTKEKVSKSKPPEKFLRLLASNKKTVKEFEKALSKKDFSEFKKTLRAIKVFEKVQQEEIEICIDPKAKTERNFRVGLTLWNKLCNGLENYPKSIKKKYLSKIRKISKSHPVIGIRRILLPATLKCFDEEICSKFKKEIKRWL